MPPKRKASTQEEAQQHSGSDTDAGKSGPARPKQAKKKKDASSGPLDASLPTNKELPTPLTLPSKSNSAQLRFVAFNIAGLKAADKKGLRFYLEAEDADLVVLTETKVAADPKLEPDYISSRYPHAYWGADPKKGYAGVAVLSKIEPKNVDYGLPTLDKPESSHGRMITLEFESLYFIGVYVPNAGQGLKTLDEKKAWNAAFEQHLRELDSKKPVIIGGDINCAQTEHDLRNPKPNWNKTPGYTQAEQEGLAAQLNPPAESGHQPLKDVWRLKHPDTVGQYTYYSYRFNCRAKLIGWRLDTFICSQRILDQVESCEIRHDCYGVSDHVPVVLDWKSSL